MTVVETAEPVVQAPLAPSQNRPDRQSPLDSTWMEVGLCLAVAGLLVSLVVVGIVRSRHPSQLSKFDHLLVDPPKSVMGGVDMSLFRGDELYAASKCSDVSVQNPNRCFAETMASLAYSENEKSLASWFYQQAFPLSPPPYSHLESVITPSPNRAGVHFLRFM